MRMATSSCHINGKATRLLLCLMMSVICIGGISGKAYAQANHWEKQIARNEWGDVTGSYYAQVVQIEEGGGEASDVRELVIVYRGNNRIVIFVGDDITSPISGFELGSGINVSLRDGNGTTQNFNGYGKSGKEGYFEVHDASFVQALRKDTKYKILIRYNGKGIEADWYARANIRGGLPITEQEKKEAKVAEERAKAAEIERVSREEDERVRQEQERVRREEERVRAEEIRAEQAKREKEERAKIYAAGTAIISIMTLPPRADVYIRGILIGKSNESDLKVPVGTHQVRFVKDGVDKTETMKFNPGKNPDKFIKLR